MEEPLEAGMELAPRCVSSVFLVIVFVSTNWNLYEGDSKEPSRLSQVQLKNGGGIKGSVVVRVTLAIARLAIEDARLRG